LREDITHLILTGGAFTTKDAALVSEAVMMLAFSIPFTSIWAVLQNVFFARKDAVRPLLAGLANLVATTGGCWLLYQKFSSTGLAAAYGEADILAVVLLLWWLPEKLQFNPGWRLGKIFLAAAALGGLVWGLNQAFAAGNFWELLVKVGGIALLGGGFYLASLKFLGVNPRKF
jgi:peptidoglycan biosynthesis protein MviN/MurJ (putative lipid II flippase)